MLQPAQHHPDSLTPLRVGRLCGESLQGLDAAGSVAGNLALRHAGPQICFHVLLMIRPPASAEDREAAEGGRVKGVPDALVLHVQQLVDELVGGAQVEHPGVDEEGGAASLHR